MAGAAVEKRCWVARRLDLSVCAVLRLLFEGTLGLEREGMVGFGGVWGEWWVLGEWFVCEWEKGVGDGVGGAGLECGLVLVGWWPRREFRARGGAENSSVSPISR